MMLQFGRLKEEVIILTKLAFRGSIYRCFHQQAGTRSKFLSQALKLQHKQCTLSTIIRHSFNNNSEMSEVNLPEKLSNNVLYPMLEFKLRGGVRAQSAVVEIENYLITLKTLLPTNYARGLITFPIYPIEGDSDSSNALGRHIHALLERCKAELTTVAGGSEISTVTGTVIPPLPKIVALYVFASILVLENCAISGALDLRRLFSESTAEAVPKGAVIGLHSEVGNARLLQIAALIVRCCQFKELAYCYNILFNLFSPLFPPAMLNDAILRPLCARGQQETCAWLLLGRLNEAARGGNSSTNSNANMRNRDGDTGRRLSSAVSGGPARVTSQALAYPPATLVYHFSPCSPYTRPALDPESGDSNSMDLSLGLSLTFLRQLDSHRFYRFRSSTCLYARSQHDPTGGAGDDKVSLSYNYYAPNAAFVIEHLFPGVLAQGELGTATEDCSSASGGGENTFMVDWNIAKRLAGSYFLNEYKDRLQICRSKFTILKHVKKNKIPLAEEVVSRNMSSRQGGGYGAGARRGGAGTGAGVGVGAGAVLGLYLYQKLVDRRHFKLADHIFHQYQLGRTGVPNIVTQRDILAEFQRNSDKFLTIPGEINATRGDVSSGADGSASAHGVQIIMVDSYESMIVAADALSMTISSSGCSVAVHESILKRDEVVLVGVDVEWHYKLPAAASLLQVAVAHKVLLFDFGALSAGGPSSRLASLAVGVLELLCSSPAFALCTWGFETSDRSMLSAAGGGLFRHCFEHIRHQISLDLWASKIYRRIQGHNVLLREDELGATTVPVLVDPKQDTSLSLSFGAHFFLGKPLDKREQLSDWNTRPLSPAQVSYAALDAFCLLGMLDCMLVYLDFFGESPPCKPELYHRIRLKRAEGVQCCTTTSSSEEGDLTRGLAGMQMQVQMNPEEESPMSILPPVPPSAEPANAMAQGGPNPNYNPNPNPANAMAQGGPNPNYNPNPDMNTPIRAYPVGKLFLGDDYVDIVLNNFRASYAPAGKPALR